MQVQAVDNNNTSFGTKVYASSSALKAIKKSPHNAKTKIFKHIKDLKNNGVDDVLLLQYEKNNTLVADIYAVSTNKNEYLITTGGWKVKDYITDPFNYGTRKSYINIKELYQSLIEDIAHSHAKTDKSSTEKYLKEFLEL